MARIAKTNVNDLLFNNITARNIQIQNEYKQNQQNIRADVHGESRGLGTSKDTEEDELYEVPLTSNKMKKNNLESEKLLSSFSETKISQNSQKISTFQSFVMDNKSSRGSKFLNILNYIYEIRCLERRCPFSRSRSLPSRPLRYNYKYPRIQNVFNEIYPNSPQLKEPFRSNNRPGLLNRCNVL